MPAATQLRDQHICPLLSGCTCPGLCAARGALLVASHAFLVRLLHQDQPPAQAIKTVNAHTRHLETALHLAARAGCNPVLQALCGKVQACYAMSYRALGKHGHLVVLHLQDSHSNAECCCQGVQERHFRSCVTHS